MSRLTFADITAPLSPDEFFTRHWTQEAVLLRHASRAFTTEFGWDAVDTILNAGDIAFPKIKVSRNEAIVPTDQFTVDAGGQRLVDGRAVLSLFREGASFGITGADSHWPPLRAVVDCFFDALLESVHTNVYCSPANTQGFQCHFDLHEVFVLQVDGAKHWRVFRPTTEAPTSSWRAEDAPHERTAPYVDVVLRAGDVLYVPRGHWHYAVAEETTSLHVTVGITCRKGMAFYDWLAGELSTEVQWRRNMPLLSDATREGAFQSPVRMREWLDELRQSLEDTLSGPDLIERFCKDMLDTIQPTHNASLVDAASNLDVIVFERPAGRRHYFEEMNGSGISVTSAGCEIQLDGGDANLVKQIFSSDSFTLADVRRWKPEVAMGDVRELLTQLTSAGLLIARRPA